MQLIPGVSTAFSLIDGLSMGAFSSHGDISGHEGGSYFFSSIGRSRTCFSNYNGRIFIRSMECSYGETS